MDGAVAKAWPSQRSVLGSYLDPLADKAVIVATGAALAAAGTGDASVDAAFAAFAARDVAMVAGGFYLRASSLGWRWRDATEFFRLVPGGSSPAAAAVEPFTVAKANTALQLLAYATAIGVRALDGGVLSEPLCAVTATAAATTTLSTALYVRKGAAVAAAAAAAAPVKPWTTGKTL